MSNTTLSKLTIFAVGAAIGSAVTWYFLKTKYEQFAEEEIESVKETFSRRPRYEGPETLDEADEESFEGKDIQEYENEVQKNGYVDYTNNKKPVKEVERMTRPYIIEPGEFDTFDDYRAESLTCYNNNVVVDDYGNVIDECDLDEMIGLETLNRFEEFDDDSVYVRNDELCTDYEILRDYSDFREDK